MDTLEVHVTKSCITSVLFMNMAVQAENKQVAKMAYLFVTSIIHLLLFF
jgi:hypothetical protein